MISRLYGQGKSYWQALLRPVDENDQELKSLLEEKYPLHKTHQDDTSSVSKKAAYINMCKTVQNRHSDMQQQDSWLSKKEYESSLLQTERP